MQVLQQESIDIVLMDIQMPGLDGMSTFKKMVKENCDADTIIISGHGSIETAVEAVRYGAHDFLEKPFSVAKLKQTVRSVVEKRSQASGETKEL